MSELPLNYLIDSKLYHPFPLPFNPGGGLQDYLNKMQYVHSILTHYRGCPNANSGSPAVPYRR